MSQHAQNTIQAAVELSLSFYNSKTGPSFSITAGTTCPGKTATCAASCYVQFGRMNLPTSRDKRDRNLSAVLGALKTPGKLADMLISALETAKQSKVRAAKHLKTIRIHDSGDFFSPAYTREWITVCLESPAIQFWAYTRSFTVPGILAELKPLARLSNVSVWLSADQDNWIAALATLKDNPEFAGIALLQTEGAEDIARILAKSLPPAQLVIFPEHKAFGRPGSAPLEGLPNCPAITGAVTPTKLLPSCLACLKCLPA